MLTSNLSTKQVFMLEELEKQVQISFQSSTDVCCESLGESKAEREGMLPKYS